MKKLILLILLIQLSNIAVGQRSSKQKSYDGFHIGLNSTNVLKNVLSFTATETDDPYSLVGLLNKGKNAFRFGLGIDFETKKSNNTNFADNTNSTVDFRVGYQKKIPVWKKLSFISGIDILGAWQNDFSVIGSISNQDVILTTGIGPIAGIVYQINERLSISTESSFYFNYSYKTVTLKQPWSNDEVTTSNEYRFKHILPNALYVYFRL